MPLGVGEGIASVPQPLQRVFVGDVFLSHPSRGRAFPVGRRAIVLGDDLSCVVEQVDEHHIGLGGGSDGSPVQCDVKRLSCAQVACGDVIAHQFGHIAQRHAGLHLRSGRIEGAGHPYHANLPQGKGRSARRPQL